jgi:holo-[acyl-carrier protein] synthase
MAVRGVGIDVVDIGRFGEALERTPSLRVRLFTEQERSRPLASLAARFAAKEAVLKLIGTADGVDPRSVEIAHQDGRPVVQLSGLAASLAAEAGVGPIDISLSHSGDHALAVAVAITESPREPRNDTA